MSSQNGQSEQSTDGSLSRRGFLGATAAALGVGALSAGTEPALASGTESYDEFRNFRATEASQGWERGYRGRRDRVVGLTDSGLEARHPALGPWNGVTAYPDGDRLALTKPAENDVDRVASGETERFSGSVGPGTFATGEERYHEFTTPADVDELDSTLSFSPASDGNDLEFRIDVWTGSRWETEARAATGAAQESLPAVRIEGERRYRYVVETYLNTRTEYEIDGTYIDVEGTVTTYDDSVVFADVDGSATPDTPKTVGWYDQGSRYGLYDRPRDPNGHGTHCSGIMGGTGRASAIDPDSFTQEAPRTTLSAVSGGVLRYEVEAEAGTGVFGSVYGTLVELRLIAPDGTRVDSSTTTGDSSLRDVHTVEEPATVSGTYTLEIGTADGEDASAATVERVGYGPFLDPDATVADRAAGGADGLHAGVAPDESLICLQGLSAPTEDLGRYAGEFASTFNLRAVNMSWGYVGGLPLGAAAGTLDRIPATIRTIAEAGILTVAAAGNAATPLNGNGSPAVADECVSVVATGPRDGISGYSSGGIGGVDEDEEDTYMKPDVTAPGGIIDDPIVAADTGDPDAAAADQPPIRDFTGKAGTSMAAPFTTGTTALVSQAMEEDGGPRLGLPAPADATFDDAMRLKQVLLATASETAFTAAPFHRAKLPTYDFGGRDPYEGYGRVNVGAAVDAVSRELSGTSAETVGLDVPFDERAVAGYVELGVGELEASVEFTGYAGDDADLPTGAPHVDLFVYDGGAPAEHGEPNVVDRAAGVAGTASVTASAEPGDGGSTYLVVAKLVDVPGATNGDDVRAEFDLAVERTPGVRARGRRGDGGDGPLGAGVLTTVEVTVEPDADVVVRDVVPDGWSVVSDLLSTVEDDDTGVTYVELGEAPAGEATTFSYAVETPTELLDLPSEHLFGPVQVDAGAGWSGVAGTAGRRTLDGS